VSTYSIGNSFDIALEASVEIPFVIHPEISSEMAFETDNGCSTELPGRLNLLSTSGVGIVSPADFAVSTGSSSSVF
jgi:hypothetical protein